MRRLVATLSFVTVVMVATIACPGSRPAPDARPAIEKKERPPVVLITIDTLRPDHMSVYGYARDTTPNLNRRAATGAVFEQAYTYWPKTRGSFVAMMSGKTAGESGYSSKYPELHAFNPTLAEMLRQDGYDTAAFVDNPNVGRAHGFDRGFEQFVEMWADPALGGDEVLSTQEITKRGVAYLLSKGGKDGFLLWLHYVNPHAPYTPPQPFDQAFTDRPRRDRTLKAVDGFFGGIPKQWAMPGKFRLSDYVNAYDGEIAYVDSQVEEVLKALDATNQFPKTTVVISSDHGESLGEHDYFFDHGANLHDPTQRVPMIVLGRSASAVKSSVLVSTLDIMPTLLDAARVSFPSGLVGRSLLPFAGGRTESSRTVLFAGSDRGHQAVWDARFKLIDEEPSSTKSVRALFDRQSDPGEMKALGPVVETRKALELALDEYRDIEFRSALRNRARLEGRAPKSMSKEECERLKALGYVQDCIGL